MKKLFAFWGMVALSLALCIAGALAADIVDDGRYDISSITDTSITISAGKTVTLYASGPGPYNKHISCGQGVTLTLENVHIAAGGCALSFTGSGNHLILTGGNSLQSAYGFPGIRVEGTTALTISGGGTLTAIGGDFCAGIGGGNLGDGGTIMVSGGTVTATGGYEGAGIGGGNNGAGGTIRVSGGTVSARGGYEGAGIGGGYLGNGGTIEISGGTAIATGGAAGAGIGGGNHGNGGPIKVSGGSVIAAGGNEGAGIGGGSTGAGGTIDVSGGTVTARGGSYAAGFGGGMAGFGGSITIFDGTVNATGGAYGAGIGGGLGQDGGIIKVSGGTVSARGGNRSAGIGGGYQGNGGTIIVSGGIVYAGRGSLGAKDIGFGYDAMASTGSLTISGSAAVFLANDDSITPTLPVPHLHKTPTDLDAPMIVINNMIYGIAGTGVSPWNTALGGYFLFSSLAYDANGGSGAAPGTITQQTATRTALAQGSGLARSGYQFSGWNTAADGSGTAYAAGSSLTLSYPGTTLYAQWTMIPPTPAPTLWLTPKPTPGLTILPKTGDDSGPASWLGLLAASAGALLIIIGALQLRRQRKVKP